VKKEGIFFIKNTTKLEIIKENRDFTKDEAKQWLETKSLLDDMYLEEEKYWHEKSRGW
jgi:hypothetical protein